MEPAPENVYRWYLIESRDLVTLELLSKRLYSQMRMNAEEMRNAAQVLQSIVNATEQMRTED
jgi:hypothetical protein